MEAGARRFLAMIISIGIDLAEVDRIEAAMARFGDHFLDRVFTEREKAYCASKANAAERFAARFAAKEAIMKALGTGWSQGIRWRDLEVGREPSGKPLVILHGQALERARHLGIHHWTLSLTHTRAHAMAQVVAEGEARPEPLD